MKLKVTVGILLATIFVVLVFYLPGPKSWQVTIATGTRGGTYLSLGEQYARVLLTLDAPIEKALPLETAGSVQNIGLLRDPEGADIAFMLSLVLRMAKEEDPKITEEIKVLANLYKDLVQVIVRKDLEIDGLKDLQGRRVYLGAKGSGTRIVAEMLLLAMGLDPGSVIAGSSSLDEVGFLEATEMLLAEQLDAAFVLAGMPNEAVRAALESGECTLLDLSDSIPIVTGEGSDFEVFAIPAEFYPNQEKRIRTLMTGNVLVCRTELDQDLVFELEDAFFNNIGNLLLTLTGAQDVRLETAFQGYPKGFELHPGVIKFIEKEKEKLHIATGAIGGRYYELGKSIQGVLEPYGISSRVIHTDGSVENVRLLADGRTLAVMQYDVALAAYRSPELIYKVVPSEDVNIPKVQDLRRIATFHEEPVHIVVRREKLTAADGPDPTVEALKNKGLRICLGPQNSGTRLIAESILRHHGVSDAKRVLLSVQDMVDKLHSGEIDCGFYVSHVPSGRILTVLEDVRIRLLSIEPRQLAKFVGPAFKPKDIEKGTYLCQGEGEPAIRTMSTRAVLVAREPVEVDIEEVTRAIFEDAAYLDIAGGTETMKLDLASLPLHPAAKRYYLEKGYLPSKPGIDWLTPTWRSLAIVVMIAAGLNGLLVLKKNRISKLEARNIHEVSLAPGENSVTKLLQIESRIQDRVKMMWWNLEELDNTKWRELEDLIDNRIEEARRNLMRKFLEEIRLVGENIRLSDPEKAENFRSLEGQIWTHLENGELSESQQSFLQRVIDHRRQTSSGS